ncbi:hypothetical protein AAFM46_16880 (plasmid) [Arthrobacter sp. TMP15]|uniref:hypothetical protein n=1 Tax=Arthrobacter sp. TMP15 TaxID=3140789 RepID=UPI0031BBAB24
MDLVFWAVLITAASLTITRLPGLSQSRNQAIFLSGLCASLAFGLMIPVIYAAVDELLFRTNFTDLFAKLGLLLAVNILVSELAKTLHSQRSLRLTAGLSGKVILVATFSLAMGLFAFTNTPTPSPGLGAYIDDPLVFAYNAVIVIYIGYLGAVITGPLVRDARTGSQTLRRAASVLLAGGFILAVVRAVILLAGFAMPSIYELGQIISGFSALLIIAGLATAWKALREYGTEKIVQSHLRIE